MKTMTFRMVAGLWEEEKKAFVKPSTLYIYRIHIQKHLLPAFGECTRLGEKQVQQFVSAKLEAGMSRNSVRDLVMVLKMILQYAAKYCGWKYASMKLQYPSARRERAHRVLSVEEEKRLLEHFLEGSDYRDLGYALCLGTGMRIGEICALRWEDIDLQTGVVQVSKTLQRVGIEPHGTRVVEGPPKTIQSFRYIPLSSRLLAVLRKLSAEAQPSWYVITGGPRPAEPAVCRRYFHHVLLQLGLPRLHFHELRHTFATRCIESQCDYKTVSALLGHASINTTLNLYVHPNLEQKQKAVEQMARLLM